MSELKRIAKFRPRSALAIAGALALVGSNASAIAADSGPAGFTEAAAESQDTYHWSAELVGYDADERIATVKARIESHADIGGLAELDEGDRAWLTWSGILSAAGVRDISADRDPGFERFTMPVEFVGTANDDQYLVFRVAVPAADAAAIDALSPGNWVTATTSHRPGEWAHAVLDIRSYNDVQQ